MRRDRLAILAGLVLFLGTMTLIRQPVAQAGGRMLAGGCTTGVGNILCDNANDSVTTTLDLFGVVSLAGGNDTLTVPSGRYVGDSSTSSTDGVIGGTGADSIIIQGTVQGQVAIAENSSLTSDTFTDIIFNEGVVNGSQVGVALGPGDVLFNNGTITSPAAAVNCISVGATGCTINDVGTITGTILGGTGGDSLSTSAVSVINGAVSLGDGSNLVISAGVITGAIVGGTGSDTLRTTSGTITGNVSLGDGSNSINLNNSTITGNIIAGTGSDTLVNTAGRINGVVSLGDGNNSIRFNSGTLDGRIQTGIGNDSLFNNGLMTGSETFILSSGHDYLQNDSLGNINVGINFLAGNDSVVNHGTLQDINLGNDVNSFTNQGMSSASVAYTSIVSSSGSAANNTVINHQHGRIGTLTLTGSASTSGNLIINFGTIDGSVTAPNGSLSNFGTASIGGSVNLNGVSRPESLANLGTISGSVSGGDGNANMYNGFDLNSISAVIGGGMFGLGGNDTLRNLERGAVGGIDGGAGDDSISNASLVSGVMVGGDGNDTVTNLAGGLANYVSGDAGNDSVSNLGAVNSSVQGGIGNDTVTNFAGAVASWVEGFDGDDRVLNGGFVNADLIGGAGNDSVVNFAGAFVSQMYGNGGNDTVINGGFLLGSAFGGDDNDVVVNLGGAQATQISGDFGNDSVFNGGYLVGGLFGGAGDDTVVNAAFSYSAGANLGDGNDTFVNGGYLNGSVDCGTGNDTLGLGGYIAGGIICGAGNDLVYIYDGVVLGTGAVIAGAINGGADVDGLGFAFNVFVANQAEAQAISAALAAQSPLGGSIVLSGVTYTWLNFEVLYNLLSFNIAEDVIITIPISRRVNQSDAAAPVAVYCTAGSVELWTVGVDGVGDSNAVGSYAFSVPYADALSGTTVSTNGITFESTAGGSFSVSATASDGKPYTFSGTCS